MIKWTRESIVEKASEFNGKVEFMKGASGAYDACHRRFPGLIDELFTNKTHYLSKEQLIDEALKYETKADFIRHSRSTYYSLITRYPGLIDNLIKDQRNNWDLSRVLDEVRKYSSISEFQIKAGGAYRWARKNSKPIISIFFSESDKRNARDSVYVWKVNDSVDLYKVGVTSSSLSDMRIKRVRWAGKFQNIETLILAKVGNPRAIEMERIMKSVGSPVKFEKKFDGHTEFRKMTPEQTKSVVSFINIMKEVK